MRWCCMLMTRDMAICILPNTATTSSFLSSNDGAPKFYINKYNMRNACLMAFIVLFPIDTPRCIYFSFWKWTVQCFISISHHHTSPFPSTYSTPVYILLPWYVQLVALTNLIVFQKWWWKWIDGLMTGCKCGWCILKALFAAINRPGCYVLAAQRFEMRRW